MTNTENTWIDQEKSPLGVFPDNLSKNLRSFLDYWTSKKPSPNGIPKRSDISPRDMINYLPGIVIIERISDNGVQRYRYRLAGTFTSVASNMEVTGKYVDDVFSEYDSRRAQMLFDQILETGQPHYLERTSPVPNREFTKYERIIAPLLDNNGEPNLIIGLWEWAWTQ